MYYYHSRISALKWHYVSLWINDIVNVTINFLTSVFRLILNIVSKKNCSIKNENKSVDLDTFDIRGIKGVTLYIIKSNSLIIYHLHVFAFRHYLWQSFEALSNYSPTTSAMKFVHNTCTALIKYQI